MNAAPMVAVFLCLLLNSFGQVLLKLFAASLNRIEAFSLPGMVTLPSTWYYLAPGLLCYVTGLVLWLYALKHLPLAVAYPVIALSFIAVPLLGWLLLAETYRLNTLLGGLLIVAGITLMSR